MNFGIPQENCPTRAAALTAERGGPPPLERRVALTPTAVRALVARGHQIDVERGAGTLAGHADEAYAEAGATLADRAQVWAADTVLKVEPPSLDQLALMREGATLISFIHPPRNAELMAALAAKKITTLAMERVPRSTIAQKCDALSSMAALAGQRAVLEAMAALQRPLGAVFSAAGKIPPAKVLVIGAGVAGLAAIGAAKANGAITRAFDTRLAAKDDVKSLGAEFLELNFEESGEGQGGYAKIMSPEFIAAEMALFLKQAPEVDVVITTALVPGAKAPRLWTREHIEAMRPGSVVVDLAAHQGGNCECTVADEPTQVPVPGGTVTVLGPTDLTSRLASTASELYATNLVNLIEEIDGAQLTDHDIATPMLLLLNGEAPPERPEAPKAAEKPAAAATSLAKDAPKSAEVAPKPAAGSPQKPGAPIKEVKKSGPSAPLSIAVGLALTAGWFALRYWGSATPSPELASFANQLSIFVLACFVGWQVIWAVTAALHTPLMAVTNAISGIIVVGALLEGSHGGLDTRAILGITAVLLAAINVFGGFWVTQRMLKMFRR